MTMGTSILVKIFILFNNLSKLNGFHHYFHIHKHINIIIKNSNNSNIYIYILIYNARIKIELKMSILNRHNIKLRLYEDLIIEHLKIIKN